MLWLGKLLFTARNSCWFDSICFVGLVLWHINHCISCQNFWDKACWFLSLRVFGLLSSSLLLFPQRFGRYVLRLYPVMANGIRTGDPRGFNKGRSSKFREGSRVRQTPEEGRRTYGPKRCGNNNIYEGNSPKTLNDNNHCMFFNVDFFYTYISSIYYL